MTREEISEIHNEAAKYRLFYCASEIVKARLVWCRVTATFQLSLLSDKRPARELVRMCLHWRLQDKFDRLQLTSYPLHYSVVEFQMGGFYSPRQRSELIYGSRSLHNEMFFIPVNAVYNTCFELCLIYF